MAVRNKRAAVRGSRLRIPRSRGAVSGFALIALGLWGALIPFLGPYFNFALTPDQEWTWTTARGWLEVLPGAASVLGGLMLLQSTNRLTAGFGGWLAAAAGAWYIVGPTLAPVLRIGEVGLPTGDSETLRAIERLAFFEGLGAVILFMAAGALGRLSVRGLRDALADDAVVPASAVDTTTKTERAKPVDTARAEPATSGRETTGPTPTASNAPTQHVAAPHTRPAQTAGAVPAQHATAPGGQPATPSTTTQHKPGPVSRLFGAKN